MTELNDRCVIGIDQSYNRTGIVAIYKHEKEWERPERIKFISIDFAKCKTNTEKRKLISSDIEWVVSSALEKGYSVSVVCERIRLFSKGKISLDYIEKTGALIAAIADTLDRYGIQLYSVDTKTWKSSIVGTSKPKENKYGIDPNKYPTIKFVQGCGHLKDILIPYTGRGKKGIIRATDGCQYEINDDLADAYCIALYGLLSEERQKLKLEKI